MPIILILAFTLSVSANTLAADTTDSIYDLAQGCYAIQSTSNDRYLKKFLEGGRIDNGLSYRFESISLSEAEHFYFKPTSLGHFLLTDREQRYLAAHLPKNVSAGRYPGKFANWKITKSSGSDGILYRFTNDQFSDDLWHNPRNGRLYFANSIWKNRENTFKLVEQSDCITFPEVATQVKGDRDALKGNPHDPIRGWIDPHAHITSYEFMGGRFMAGEPFHPWGVAEALHSCNERHGKDGALDLIGNLQGFGDPNARHSTDGWPNFTYWPNYASLSHMGYYYKWMERAYLSGQRMVTTFLVENEVLCSAQSTINPAGWINPNSCNVMDSLRLQAARLMDMQQYIDAQSGGPGEGWFQIVTSPEQARAVIADGKLAVLMGIEASETFDCGLRDTCTRDSLDAKLDELYQLGVRSLYPTHKFDNQIGGSRVEDGFINMGQWLSTGHFFETAACDSATQGVAFTSGFPIIGEIPFVRDILKAIGLDPQYDESIQHCNKHGLTELGVYLVNRLIDKKMLIELDHLSSESASLVMDIAEARGYSGLVTSHSWMNPGINNTLHPTTKRLFAAGGFGAPYNTDAHGMESRIAQYLDEIEQTPYLPGVGMGSDMSGLGTQAGPRSDADSNPLIYPFTNEFGLTFEKQVSGNRTFDLNTDGMAHYGLMADHIEDMRNINSERIYEAIMSSAEAYLQMWERAESSPQTHYHNPL